MMIKLTTWFWDSLYDVLALMIGSGYFPIIIIVVFSLALFMCGRISA